MKYCMYFAFLYLIHQTVIAEIDPKEVKDNKNNVITLELIDDKNIAEDLKDQRLVFNEAFWEARVRSGLAENGNETTKQNFLKIINSGMDDVKKLLSEGKNSTFGISAKKNEKIIGFVIFSKERDPGVVYINQCAVQPSEWENGITTQLIKTILRLLPDTKKIEFVARRKNKVAQAFYTHCVEKYPTLKPTNYMHAGYDPKVYQGYEFVIPNE